MIESERLKRPVLYFLGFLFVIVLIGNMFERPLFFDREGRIKHYGFTEDCTPMPLISVVILTALVTVLLVN
jgi:hypothetical protein